jgi:hypothetical protein
VLDPLPQSHPFYAGLKTATAQLFAEFGEGKRGQTMAAKATRVGQQRLSDYANRNEERDFIPADVIFDLEKASGTRPVSEYLAEALNCLLIPLPEGTGAGCVLKGSGEMAEDLGQVLAEIGKALRDGKLSPAEAGRITSKLYDLIASAHALVKQVEAEAEALR